MTNWLPKLPQLQNAGEVGLALVSHFDDQAQIAPEEQNNYTADDIGQSGFTLVEALAAFAMLAVILTVIFSGITQTLKSDRHVDLIRQALALAQSKLDQFGILEPLTPGNRSGVLDGIAWTVNIRPAKTNADSPRVFWVTVSASMPQSYSGNPLSVTVTTLKLEGRPYGR